MARDVRGRARRHRTGLHHRSRHARRQTTRRVRRVPESHGHLFFDKPTPVDAADGASQSWRACRHVAVLVARPRHDGRAADRWRWRRASPWTSATSPCSAASASPVECTTRPAPPSSSATRWARRIRSRSRCSRRTPPPLTPAGRSLSTASTSRASTRCRSPRPRHARSLPQRGGSRGRRRARRVLETTGGIDGVVLSPRGSRQSIPARCERPRCALGPRRRRSVPHGGRSAGDIRSLPGGDGVADAWIACGQIVVAPGERARVELTTPNTMNVIVHCAEPRDGLLFVTAGERRRDAPTSHGRPGKSSCWGSRPARTRCTTPRQEATCRWWSQRRQRFSTSAASSPGSSDRPRCGARRPRARSQPGMTTVGKREAKSVAPRSAGSLTTPSRGSGDHALPTARSQLQSGWWVIGG